MPSTINKGVFIQDPTTATVQAKVQGAAPAATDVGLTVRPIFTPQVSGGFSVFHLSSAASTNPNVIKNAPGQVFGWILYNNAASRSKLVFHNSASAPTAGANVFFTVALAATTPIAFVCETGIAFSNGIAITITNGMADANASAVAADDFNVNIFYK